MSSGQQPTDWREPVSSGAAPPLPGAASAGPAPCWAAQLLLPSMLLPVLLLPSVVLLPPRNLLLLLAGLLPPPPLPGQAAVSRSLS